MEEWKECKLGEYLYIKGRIGWKGLKKDEYLNKSPYRIINGESLTEKGIEWSKAGFITKERYDESPEIMLEINDILLSKDGTIGKIGFVKELLSPTTVASGIFVIRNIKPEIIDTMFIYHFLRSSKFKNFIKMRTEGSVIPHLYQKDFEELNFPLPPLSIQQKIAAIFSSLDDKIELNNKINTNLEQQAQALFKNWFVDFEPFGGKMPEGWKVGKLSEYCNFQEGYVNPAQTHNEYFDGDVKWLRAVDINESFIINTSRTLTKYGFESAGKSAFLFKPGSIAISKSGTVGRLGIISDYMCGNRAVIGIELKEQQNLSYIHQYLKSRQTEFPEMAVGSVQKNLYVSILENLDIIIPPKELLEKYAKICMPFYDYIKTNCIENNNLRSIRDTLLPKLMNGEIAIDKDKTIVY